MSKEKYSEKGYFLIFGMFLDIKILIGSETFLLFYTALGHSKFSYLENHSTAQKIFMTISSKPSIHYYDSK